MSDRTTVYDFEQAFLRVDERLAEYDAAKGSVWKTLAPALHLSHAWSHVARAEIAMTEGKIPHCRRELTAATLRMLMALEVFERMPHADLPCP